MIFFALAPAAVAKRLMRPHRFADLIALILCVGTLPLCLGLRLPPE